MLNIELNAGLSERKMKLRLAELGGATLALSAADYGKLLTDEVEKWAKVIRVADIKPEQGQLRGHLITCRSANPALSETADIQGE